MTLRQKLSLGLMMPVTLALVALLAAALAQSVPDISPSSAESQFDSSRALADAARLAHDYPGRVVGSPENALARAWITTRFAELGLKVETLPFTVTVASRARRGVLVWATVPGESEEVILVSAHYDTSPATNSASNDNPAGVAALLELARLFAAEQPRHTLIFLACDSNAYGPAWGAKNFAERFQGRIVAALDLEHPPGVVRSIRIEDTGLRSGYAPLWLQQAGLASLNRIGSFAVEADSLRGYLRRALPVSTGDYAAYLRARVPAIGLSAVVAPTVRGNGASPSAQDLGAYGRIAETWLRTVDALNPIPQATTYNFDLRLSEGRYLPGWAAAGLQLLLFAPLFLATAMAWQADRPSTDELKPEFFALMGLVVAGLDGYAVAYSLVVLGALPRYEMFPASPGDPFLLRPDWLAALAVFGTVALFGWFTFRRGGWGRFADMLHIPY
ncbi:MAG: M28 family peptidase, partial [Anaerolineales bacterium]